MVNSRENVCFVDRTQSFLGGDMACYPIGIANWEWCGTAGDPFLKARVYPRTFSE